jgi:hypothetical protein
MTPSKHVNTPPEFDPSLLTEREEWVAEQTMSMMLTYLLNATNVKMK